MSTTTTYYIKTAADDIKHAMEKLQSNIPQAAPAVRDTYRAPEPEEQATDQAIQ